MSEPGWRLASDVLDFRGSREPSCPACPFPIRPSDAVVRAGRRSWAHAFCAAEDEG